MSRKIPASTRIPPPPNRIALGIIRKPHGVRGEASIEPWTDDPDRFALVSRVFLVSPDESEACEVHLESWRPHTGRLLLRFVELSTPEEVGEFREWTVEIPAAEARKPEDGEYFLHELVGMRLVESGSGSIVGTVNAVLEGGGGFLLSAESPEGRAFDVPFATSICQEIDRSTKTIRVELPQGLLDLDSIRAVEEERPVSGPKEEPQKVVAVEPGEPSLRIDVVTIFPRMFDPFLAEGIVSRGIRNGALKIVVWDLRDFAADRHHSTDDEAYGGGAGMVMLADPLFRCVEAIREGGTAGVTPQVVALSPQGEILHQKLVGEMSGLKWMILLCGRYEGFDQRVLERIVDREISIGDFVVSGGEIPSMLLIEAVGRMIEGVVGDPESVEQDSFFRGLLDHPHYTRPAEYRGMKVPEVLLSGHAEKIRRWRREQALRATLEKRPDLLESAELDDEARAILKAIRSEGED